MIGVTSALMEGLIRLEMKPFEICLDLTDISIEGRGKDCALALIGKPREITRIVSPRLRGRS